MTMLDVVICTYNRAADLKACLAALAAQRDAGDGWRVTVVDNNSTDATADVVAAQAARGKLPGLRRLVETTQGLTPARLRGVRESAAEWIAFVDDDCIVSPDWVTETLRFAAAHPEAGAFGGRVLPDWGRAPPAHLKRHGWLFAEQDHGADPRIVGNLVGTGVVLNARALEAVGWTAQPYLADRIGRAHVSGGDVEIGCRLAAGGYALWYAPGPRIDHRIAPSRQRMSRLLSLAHGLGAGAELVSLMGASDPEGWPDRVAAHLRDERRRHVASTRYVVTGKYPWQDWLIRAAFLAGQRKQHRALSRDAGTRTRLGGLWAPSRRGSSA
jgi:glucosyl-dolichyl phosphate glucuronosyltransferase